MMIISFFESFKYIGHLWPVSLLRIFVGSIFLRAGLEKIHNGFLQNPVLQDILAKWSLAGTNHPSYAIFLHDWVSPHWKLFSHLVAFGEIFVGLSFILGFMVRPAAVIAIFMNINFMLAAGMEAQVVNTILIVVNLTLLLLSAGRCIGMDYYFYKRVRGLWW
jgi:thiosulfate dehydrogenase [quinone] large subunit